MGYITYILRARVFTIDDSVWQQSTERLDKMICKREMY